MKAENIFVISESSQPVCLVQTELEARIKNGTKIFIITNEGENEYNEYANHCETLLSISADDRLQADFEDKLYNALSTIWKTIKSSSGEKAIYLNNIYSFFDDRYKTNKCAELLVDIFKNARKYDCSIIVFNWKPIDFTTIYSALYRDNGTNYISIILNNVQTFVITSIQSRDNMRIVSEVFRLTANEEKTIQSLKPNEGMRIFDNRYMLYKDLQALQNRRHEKNSLPYIDEAYRLFKTET